MVTALLRWSSVSLMALQTRSCKTFLQDAIEEQEESSSAYMRVRAVGLRCFQAIDVAVMIEEMREPGKLV